MVERLKTYLTKRAMPATFLIKKTNGLVVKMHAIVRWSLRVLVFLPVMNGSSWQKKREKTIITELDLGMCYSRARSLVGITGTNGKTSLATILSHVANNLGLPSIALGNIGHPLSSAAVTWGKRSEKIFFSKPVLFKLSLYCP